MDPFHYISIQTFYKINMNGSIPLHIHTKIGGSNIRVYSSSTPPFQSPWTLTLVCCLFFPVPVDSYPCLLSFLSSPRGLLPLFVGFALQSPWTLTLVCWLCFTVPVRVTTGTLTLVCWLFFRVPVPVTTGTLTLLPWSSTKLMVENLS